MWGTMAAFIGALMILASFNLCDGHLKYITSLTGEVSRGNITHFSMGHQGTLLLEMSSVTGDCDLYVSQFTLRPTYEPHSYCLQSMTCGLDTVIVPKSFKRPFGIGIFGYPTHTDCQYSLLFFEMDDIFDIDTFPGSASDAEEGEGKEDTGTGGGKSKSTGEEENDMKETKEKKRIKKIEDAVRDKKLKAERRRKYLGGESYLWLLLDYLIECLLELIL